MRFVGLCGYDPLRLLMSFGEPALRAKAKPIRGIRVIRGQLAPQFWNQVKALGYLCYLLLKVPRSCGIKARRLQKVTKATKNFPPEFGSKAKRILHEQTERTEFGPPGFGIKAAPLLRLLRF